MEKRTSISSMIRAIFFIADASGIGRVGVFEASRITDSLYFGESLLSTVSSKYAGPDYRRFYLKLV